MSTRALNLVIETVDNAAFDLGQRNAEIARIIKSAAQNIQGQAHPLDGSTSLRDINGNKVGYTKVASGTANAPGTDAFHLYIELENDAFIDAEPDEVSRILMAAAKNIETGTTNFSLRDINGNTVGKVTLAEASIEDGNVDLGSALREDRVYLADSGYDGIADGEFRYAVTHPDTPVGYRMEEINVWLVNAAGEISGDLQSVKENSLSKLTRQDAEQLEKVIRGDVSLEEHEQSFQAEDDDSPSM